VADEREPQRVAGEIEDLDVAEDEAKDVKGGGIKVDGVDPDSKGKTHGDWIEVGSRFSL
jgi:hypothetical protein